MAALLDGVRRCFREHKNKGPRQPPEANADRDSPVRKRIIAQRINVKKFLSKLDCVPLREARKREAIDFTPWLAESFRPKLVCLVHRQDECCVHTADVDQSLNHIDSWEIFSHD